jgi:hypothetical protein
MYIMHTWNLETDGVYYARLECKKCPKGRKLDRKVAESGNKIIVS